MGNSTSSRNPSRRAGKVIFWDGAVQELDRMTTLMAAELMLDHPQHVVVELQSAVTARRPRPLPADEKLEAGKVYLMLPVRRGKPASMSSEEARRVLLMATSAIRSPCRSSCNFMSYTGFFPLLARVCTTGIGRDERYHRRLDSKRKNGEHHGASVKDRDEKKVVAVLKQGSSWMPELDLTDVSEDRPEYLSRQLSGKGWKPSLDTIIEKKMEERVPHWLF